MNKLLCTNLGSEAERAVTAVVVAVGFAGRLHCRLSAISIAILPLDGYNFAENITIMCYDYFAVLAYKEGEETHNG